MQTRNNFNSDEEYEKYLLYYFSAQAMNGLCSNGGFTNGSSLAIGQYSEKSISIAQCLIKKLKNL